MALILSIKWNLLRASCTLPVLSDSEGASPKLREFPQHLSNQPKSQFLTRRPFVIWFSFFEDLIRTTRKEEHSKGSSRTWVSLPPDLLLNFKVPVLTDWGYFWDEETSISALRARLSINQIDLPEQDSKFYWKLNFIRKLIPHPILWDWRTIKKLLPLSFNTEGYNPTTCFLQTLQCLVTERCTKLLEGPLQDQIDLSPIQPCCCRPYINLWQEEVSSPRSSGYFFLLKAISYSHLRFCLKGGNTDFSPQLCL